MKPFLLSALAAAVFAAAAPALAKNVNCPPGLAKKAVPCVPPGLAKKSVRYFGPGDYVGDYDYHYIRYPDRYLLPPLPPGERYVIIGNQLLRVSEGTYEVLALIRLVDQILD
jgi:hypothetical protein